MYRLQYPIVNKPVLALRRIDKPFVECVETIGLFKEYRDNELAQFYPYVVSNNLYTRHLVLVDITVENI